MAHLKVFLSYAYDSLAHKQWVLRLATDLRKNGIDAVLDQWHLRAGADIGQFMIASVHEAGRVLIVCSERYVDRAFAGTGGAGFEAGQVTAALIEDQGTTKFIPIMRENRSRRLPAFLGFRRYIDFSDDALYDETLMTLLRELYGAHLVDLPAIGPNPFVDPLPLPSDPSPVATQNQSELFTFSSPEIVKALEAGSDRRFPDNPRLEELQARTAFYIRRFRKGGLSEEFTMEEFERALVAADLDLNWP